MRARTLSAGVVVVRREGGTPYLLLLRAFRTWDFPKGEVELGEEPRAAAAREVREETGITDLRFNWGDAFCETAPYGRGKVARYYLAETDEREVVLGVSPSLGRPEHHGFRWATAAEARALLPTRLLPVLEWVVSTTGAS